jgi:hypothetical protein
VLSSAKHVDKTLKLLENLLNARRRDETCRAAGHLAPRTVLGSSLDTQFPGRKSAEYKVKR